MAKAKKNETPSRKRYHTEGHRKENKLRRIRANSGPKAEANAKAWEKAFAGRN